MGTSMATNLLDFLSEASPEDPFEPKLHVYNRTQSKADKLVSQGALLAPSVAGTVRSIPISDPSLKITKASYVKRKYLRARVRCRSGEQLHNNLLYAAE